MNSRMMRVSSTCLWRAIALSCMCMVGSDTWEDYRRHDAGPGIIIAHLSLGAKESYKTLSSLAEVCIFDSVLKSVSVASKL